MASSLNCATYLSTPTYIVQIKNQKLLLSISSYLLCIFIPSPFVVTYVIKWPSDYPTTPQLSTCFMDVPLTWYNLGVLSWVTCCNPVATPPSKIRIPSYAKKKEIDQSRASFLLKSTSVKNGCTKSKNTLGVNRGHLQNLFCHPLPKF